MINPENHPIKEGGEKREREIQGKNRDREMGREREIKAQGKIQGGR